MSEKKNEKSNENADENAGFFDQPGNVRLVLRIFYAACAVLVLLDVISVALHFFGAAGLRHAERWWEGLPGFYAVYGFVGCALLVLIAKVLRKVLMREEDYYDR